MCGIHFAINTAPTPNNVDDFLRDAFIANQVRGLDSSGIYQVTPIGKIISHKEACTASEFIEGQQVRNVLGAAVRCPLTVGHVRHATAGKVTRQNAHPFIVNRDDGSQLVGVHNGTLKDWRHKDLGDKFDVDSEWALRMIARLGVEAFKYFDGAYAFVWHDTKHPDSVFMARNEQRPLHFMRSEDGKTLLGASELGMLGWLAERNGFKIEKEKANSSGMYYLAPGRMYKFSLKDVGDYSSVELPKYDASTGVYKAPENFPAESSGRYYPHSDGNYNNWGYNRGSSTGYSVMPYRMDERLDHYKKALQQARDARIGVISGAVKEEETTVGKDLDPALEEGIKNALVKWNDEQVEKSRGTMLFEQLIAKPIFLSDPKDSYATNAEEDKARELKIFGQVVLTRTELFEKDLGLLYGEFDIVDSDTGVIFSLMSEMRFADSAQAYAYMNRQKPVAIVGYREGNNGGTRTAVALVAPLSPLQQQLVENKLLNRRRKAAH